MATGFEVGQHNAHYEGVYSAQEQEWRRICAIDKAAHIADLLGEAGGQIGSVLEVGCGTGAVLARLSSLGIGREFTGIDVVDPNMNLETDGATGIFRWSAYDGVTIPFADGAFDLVYASHVLEHVPEQRPFLRELARVARRYVFVEVPCELHGRTSHRAMQSTLNIGHINFYTPDTFLLMLQTSGLKVSKLGVYDHSVEVQAFHTSKIRGFAKSAVRKALLAISPQLATRIATYHCAALCQVSGDMPGSFKT